MGTATSTHQPLDRSGASPFKRHASCRATKGERRGSPKRMDRLRRSFRDSFRRRKEHIPESSKPHLWQADEAAVRAGTCTFQVKYLGCVEVFESRGMQVCEEALKVLRNSRRRPVKAVLFVSGDGLRVVEDETKGLIVDQTIEKVSFCAPDRGHEKGFSYICRDGTTRRWMCHGFIALKESGERLSHAVGCAFSLCLERKQRREKECGVTMTFDPASSAFTRQGSFRTQTITDRIADPNKNTITVPTTEAPPPPPTTTKAPPPVTTKPPVTTHAIERPHATVSMLVRQGSFRGFNHLSQTSPFKRQLSLRISDLPSNLERTRSLSLEGSSDPRAPPLIHLKTPAEREALDTIAELPLQQERQRYLSLPFTDEVRPPSRLRLFSLPTTKVIMSPIPESSPLADKTDPVSAMCMQLSQGLQLLSNADDLIPFANNIENKNLSRELFPMNNNLSAKGDCNEMTSTPLGSHRMLTPPDTPSASPIPVHLGNLPKPEQWLGKVAAGLGGGGRPSRSMSLGGDSMFDWGDSTSPPNNHQVSTNPFISSGPAPVAPPPVKAFEVHM